jgi:amino acid transporter
MWVAFVQIWAASTGRGGTVVMTVIAELGLILSTTCAVTASSRLIFAIARDGILPRSRWIAKPSPQGQPRNAVTIILVVSTLLLIISIGSQVAFTRAFSVLVLQVCPLGDAHRFADSVQRRSAHTP